MRVFLTTLAVLLMCTGCGEGDSTSDSKDGKCPSDAAVSDAVGEPMFDAGSEAGVGSDGLCGYYSTESAADFEAAAGDGSTALAVRTGPYADDLAASYEYLAANLMEGQSVSRAAGPGDGAYQLDSSSAPSECGVYFEGGQVVVTVVNDEWDQDRICGAAGRMANLMGG